MAALTLDDCKERLLARLEQAGASGLSKRGLGIKGGSDRRGRLYIQALEELEQEQRIKNLGSPSRSCYVLSQHPRPLEAACAHIRSKGAPETPILYSRSELLKGLTGQPRKKGNEAITLLLESKELLCLHRGQQSLFVHTHSVSSLIPRAPQGTEPTAPAEISGSEGSPLATRQEGSASWAGSQASPEPSSSTDSPTVKRKQVRATYQQLVQENGTSDVAIVALHRRLGIPLEDLQELLFTEYRQGYAVPRLGDWATASKGERDAAISINQRPYLRIQLRD